MAQTQVAEPRPPRSLPLAPLRPRRLSARDLGALAALVGLATSSVVAGLAPTVAAAVFGGLGYCAVAMSYVYLRGRRITRYARDLVELLDDGRFEDAELHARAMAEHDNRVLRVVGTHDLAYVMLRTARYAEACALYRQVRRAPIDWRLLDQQASEGIALAQTLAGDPETGRHTLEAIVGPDFGVPTTRVVTDCRVGDFDAALRRDLAPRNELVHRYLDHEIRVVHLLRAFAMERTGRRADPLFAERHGAARPGYPQEYDYLTLNWPELRAFLAYHPWPENARLVRAALPNAAALPVARLHRR